MKKGNFVKHALGAASAFILSVAALAVATPCIVVFYQPKTPHNLAERLDAIKQGI